MDYKYKFSVIMAVYNVEDYLNEAVESLVNQTIGFDSVQVILVDDGSPDNSGALCDELKNKYPDNIVVVHKENGGVSSARNEGLKHIQGKYVNCMDPDDILTEKTLENVYNFFEENYNACDICGIPITMFGDTTGGHYLNDKFARGTRVINLKKEVYYFQLSCSSAFIKNEVARTIHFDESLTVAEDAQQIIRILIDKPFLGVVTGCHYGYRKHAGSALAKGLKPCWYNDYIYRFIIPSIQYAEEKYGYLPRFVQNALMSNLQWRLSEKTVPTAIDSEDFKKYQEGLKLCIDKFDDDIIMHQKHCSDDVRVDLISIKYPSYDFVTYEANDIIAGHDSDVLSRLSRGTFKLDFLEIDSEFVTISARKTLLGVFGKISRAFVKIDDKIYESEAYEYMEHGKLLGKSVSTDCCLKFKIPKADIYKKNVSLDFYVTKDDVEIHNVNVVSGPFFPLEKKYKSSYFYDNGYVYQLKGAHLTVTKGRKRKYEKRLYRELWKSNGLGERKAIIARTLARIYKFFHPKPIWIISDRLNKSGDNGEAFFRHLKNIKFKGAKFYYAISKCPSYYKMKSLGGVIN